jgi:integrase/recombinase XerD
MPIDPKKDPVRRCRRVESWPTLDRRAWEAAMDQGDVLEPGGGGADWAPSSRRKIGNGYGRWLTWLEVSGLFDPDADPAARVTPDRVRDYVIELKTLNAPYSVLARVQELYQAIRVMAPEQDWAWLRGVENRVRHAAIPVRNKRLRVAPSDTLFAFGIELMTTAGDPESGSSLKRACQYRDGLAIALLAARPLRRRNFAAIEIGRHLVRQGEAYWLRFEGCETKTGEPIEAPLPHALVPRLEHYLSVHRPFLLARDGRWKRFDRPSGQRKNALWISEHGSAMTEIAIYFRVRRLTKARFGRVINLHLFRDSAATSTAIEDPEHVHIVRSILGHSTLRSGERYYIHAQSLEASQRYQERILELRRLSRRRSKD